MVRRGRIAVAVHLHPAQLRGLAWGRQEDQQEQEQEQETGAGPGSHVQPSHHNWTTHPFFLFMILQTHYSSTLFYILYCAVSVSETLTDQLKRQLRLI